MIQVRINGRGNAWPIIIGQEHPFYNRSNIEDLANTSISILNTQTENYLKKEINWELLLDAGHGAVQYIIKNYNRIPEALFLTHPHIDHTLGIDWLAQSYFKIYNRPYPVYATTLCWKKVVSTFPQLEAIVEFKKLVPYDEITVSEVKGVKVTPYPVYHGQSAEGAVMLYFTTEDNIQKKNVLFTGDILCPLLREQDYEKLKDIDLVIADANNRFPYPKSNHWSISSGPNGKRTKFLQDFLSNINFGNVLFPHIKFNITDNYSRCFDYFLNQEINLSEFMFSIEEFALKLKPKHISLVHYSGSEDENYYKEERLSEHDLAKWLDNKAIEIGLPDVFNVSYVGQHMNFINDRKSSKKRQ